MKQRKQLFSPAALKKDITRFAPVWGLYTVFTLMVLFLYWADDSTPVYFARNSQYILRSMGIVNLLYGGLCALVLFGDLFSSKLCNALHAMPVRREGWFLTHLVAGLLFCLAPNLLCTAVAAALLEEYCYLAFLWLGVTICQFLFFFGTAAFAVQCAGNHLGAVAIYALINFLSTLAAFLADTFYLPLLYGIVPRLEAVLRWSPPVGFTQSQYVQTDYDYDLDIPIIGDCIGADFRYLLIATAVGLLFLGGAVLLYRRRKMESAGDFIAVKAAAPIFLVIYTLCVGAVLYFLADLFAEETQYLFLLIGFAIGFFTGWMLLERKVHIFTLRRLLGFGALVLVLFCTVAATWLDPLGITRYVPDAEAVESVDISPYDSDYYLESRSLNLTDPEEIAEILSIHQDLTDNRSDYENGFCLRLRYRLRSGKQVQRRYYLSGTDARTQKTKKYFSRFSYVTGEESVEEVLKGAQLIEFYAYNTYPASFQIKPQRAYGENDKDASPETVGWRDPGRDNHLNLYAKSTLDKNDLCNNLMQAVFSDCALGAMTQQWGFHNTEPFGHIRIQYGESERTSQDVEIVVYPGSVHTTQFLQNIRDHFTKTD